MLLNWQKSIILRIECQEDSWGWSWVSDRLKEAINKSDYKSIYIRDGGKHDFPIEL